jgi:type IV pilus assembly protein PilN
LRIAINLATRPFADIGPAVKRLRIAIAALVVVAIAVGLGLHALHQKAEQARARDHSLDGKIAQITQERQGYQTMMRQPDNSRTLTQAESLNALFDEKAFSWTLAIDDLETVLPAGVVVTTIEPTRAKDGHITLRMRVVGPRNRAVNLVQNLEHSRRFLLPRIVGENSETTGGPGERAEPVSESNRVDFEVLAEYKPADPGERNQVKSKPETTTRATRTVSRPPMSGAVPDRTPYTGVPRPRAPIQPRAGGPQ